MTDRSNLSIALTGDILLTRRVSVFREERFLRMREILNTADAVFTNFDSNIHAYLDDPHQQRPSAGSYLTTEPALLDELKWLNINLIACGSTHADDYGPKGILDTIRHFDAAGITHAGSGRNLAEARAPGYLDTANGRVALLAASGSFHHGSRAGEQRSDTLGWPGVNGVRHKAIHHVDAEMLAQLRRIGEAIGWEKAKDRAANQGGARPADSETSYDFLGKAFELGEPGETTTVNARDLAAALANVRSARVFADRVISSLHCHEQGGPTMHTASRRSEVEDMADFVVDYGRQCLDAGADVFVGHGPQLPLAIEIHKGKPLFHSLGTFIFQIETVKHLPSEAYERYGLDSQALPADFLERRYKGGTVGHTGEAAQWEQMFAMLDYEGDKLSRIRVYPIDLGFGLPPSQRGRPMLADAATGDRILKRIQRLSARYGTDMRIEDGIGVISL
jgi:poly-gamma-glutamate capsule biosynthesis protein CapA/YwtB (metallophosphatase superfamily)